MTFFERLVKETETERNALYAVPQIRDGMAGKISLETYIAYLTEAYHHVKHTSPLLMLCGSKIPFEKEWLRAALAEYIEEEAGHQEWILSDIKNAGGDAEAVRHGTPNLATEMMVAYAYYYIQNVNPAGFFGMVFVLEGTSTAMATNAAGNIQQSLGLGKNCFSYLLSHGTLDIKHMEFFQSLMDKMDDPADQEAIIHVAKRMFLLFAEMFKAIPHKS